MSLGLPYVARPFSQFILTTLDKKNIFPRMLLAFLIIPSDCSPSNVNFGVNFFLWRFQDKVRNFFLVETLNEDSVLRTKRCLFAVTEEEEQERRQKEAEEDGNARSTL